MIWPRPILTKFVHMEAGGKDTVIGAPDSMHRGASACERAGQREISETQWAIADSEFTYLMEEAAKAMNERGRLHVQLQALAQTQASLAALPANPTYPPALQVGGCRAGQAHCCMKPLLKAHPAGVESWLWGSAGLQMCHADVSTLQVGCITCGWITLSNALRRHYCKETQGNR